jgi:hypothetical protein
MMRGDLTLDTLGYLVLTVLSVAVGLGLMNSLGSSNADIHPVEDSIKSSDYPVCSEFEVNQTVGREGFRTILYGRTLGACDIENNSVELGFELKKEFVREVAGELSEQPEVIERNNCKDLPGINGVLIDDTNGDKIGTFGDKIWINGTDPVKVCSR